MIDIYFRIILILIFRSSEWLISMCGYESGNPNCPIKVRMVTLENSECEYFQIFWTTVVLWDVECFILCEDVAIDSSCIEILVGYVHVISLYLKEQVVD